MPYITLPTLPGNLEDVAWRPQGDKFAVIGTTAPQLWVVDAQTGNVETGWPSASATRNVAWSPDGTMLAVVGGNPTIQVIDVESKTTISGFPQMGGTNLAVQGLAFSNDGQYLAARGAIVALANKGLVTVPSSPGSVRTMVWDPNGGNRIAVAGNGLSVWVPDGQGGFEEESGWPAPGFTVICAAWSPDGSRLALGNLLSGPLLVLDVASKSAESGWPTPPGQGVRGLAWSGDGSRLAVAHQGGNNVSVYDVASKEPEFGWPALPGFGNGVAFAFDPGNSTSG